MFLKNGKLFQGKVLQGAFLRESLGTLGNVLKRKLFRFAYIVILGKQQPKFIYLESNINPSLKPLGTIKARLAKPKVFT